MAPFSSPQLRQLGDKLQDAQWTAGDVTNFGQAPIKRLIEVRDSFRPVVDIVTAVEASDVALWRADGQNNPLGYEAFGYEIFAHLIESGRFAKCADEKELMALQAKGIEFFRKHLRDCVLGWRGLRSGRIPYLCEDGHEVVYRYGKPIGGRFRSDLWTLIRT